MTTDKMIWGYIGCYWLYIGLSLTIVHAGRSIKPLVEKWPYVCETVKFLMPATEVWGKMLVFSFLL